MCKKAENNSTKQYTRIYIKWIQPVIFNYHANGQWNGYNAQIQKGGGKGQSLKSKCKLECLRVDAYKFTLNVL